MMTIPAASADATRIYNELLVTTSEHIHPGIRENALDAHPLMSIMVGNIGDVLRGDIGNDGANPMGGAMSVTGESIRVNVKLDANGSFGWVDNGYAQASLDTSDTARGTRANFKFGMGSVTISGTELRMNSGDAQVASLLQYKQNDSTSSAVDKVAQALCASSPSPNAITSLEQIISANDSLQGINGATHAGWNSRGVSDVGTSPGSISFASGSFAAQGLADMRKADNRATEGSNTPNVLVTTDAIHEFYEGSLTPNVRFNDTRMGDLGFNSLTFRRKPIFHDHYVPSGTMYFLNTNCLWIKHLPGALFDLTPMERGQNQDAFAALVLFQGNACTDSRRYQNKLTGITA